MEKDNALSSNSDEDSLPDTAKSATHGKLSPPSGSSSSSENETESEDGSESENDATLKPAAASKKTTVLAEFTP
jgi:hypothetical protein